MTCIEFYHTSDIQTGQPENREKGNEVTKTKKPVEPRKSTTMRLRTSLLKALDKETVESGATSRTALTEAILTKYLRSRGHKHLKQRTLL